MKKSFACFLLLFLLFIPSFAMAKSYLYLRPSDFAQNPGSWTVTEFADAFEGTVLFGRSDVEKTLVKNAVISFEAKEEGSYRLWVRSRDYTTMGQGKRVFAIALNDQWVPFTLGKHGTNGFSWENTGLVSLQKGHNKISLMDLDAYFPRFDLILFTNDLTFIPSNDLASIAAHVSSQPKVATKSAQDGEIKEIFPQIKNPREGGWLFYSGFDGGIGVKIDGVYLSFDQKPYIENGRTLVPMRKIFEAFAMSVTWTPETQSITAEKEGMVIELAIGSGMAKVNGQEKTLDQPPVITGGRTMVPLRFIGEALDKTVTWLAEIQTVVIE